MGCGASKALAVSEPVALSSSGSIATVKEEAEATGTPALPVSFHATDRQEQQHIDGTVKKISEDSSAAAGYDPCCNSSHSAGSVMEAAVEFDSTKSREEAPVPLSEPLFAADQIASPSPSPQPEPNENFSLNSDAEAEKINGSSNLLQSQENFSTVDPRLEHPEASPLPLSTGGDIGLAESITQDEPPTQADAAAVEAAIAQNSAETVSAYMAEAPDDPNEDSDRSSVDADDRNSAEKEEQEAENSDTPLNIDPRDSITKLSDLTEADYFGDSTKLSYLTDLEKCSPFDSPPHYFSRDFANYTEDAMSSARSERKISSPSSAGSLELDTGTYMQDLLRKINLAKESITDITEEAFSSSTLQDFDLSRLFAEKHDTTAITNHGKLCAQIAEPKSDTEEDFSQIL